MVVGAWAAWKCPGGWLSSPACTWHRVVQLTRGTPACAGCACPTYSPPASNRPPAPELLCIESVGTHAGVVLPHRQRPRQRLRLCLIACSSMAGRRVRLRERQGTASGGAALPARLARRAPRYLRAEWAALERRRRRRRQACGRRRRGLTKARQVLQLGLRLGRHCADHGRSGEPERRACLRPASVDDD